MHFDRLAIEAGADTFTLDLHERLTVIAGVGRLERDGLVNELVSGLSTGRPGVHLEIRTDTGERYAIFRPSNGAPRVVDIERAADVTSAFTDRSGHINILERAGLGVAEAKRAVRITAADVVTTSQGDELVERLARIEPNRLWDVARKVVESEARLTELAEAMGSAAEDVGAFEEIERRHLEFEAAQAEAENARSLSFLLASACAIAALPGLLLIGPFVALPLLVAAGFIGTYSLRVWRRADLAGRQEEEALAAIGERSYLSFQVNRVNGLVATESQRQRLLHAAAEHRAAQAQWELLADDVPPDWALDHRRAIAAAHARLRETHGAVLGTALTVESAPTTPSAVEEVTNHLAQHLARIRRLGANGESFPAFLDDPFIDLAPDQKAVLLGRVLAAAGHQQIVLLTADPDVVTWARLEAVGGSLTLVEPAGGGADDATQRRSRHVAA